MTINHFVPLIDLPQSAYVEGVEIEMDSENDDDGDGVQANDSMDDASPP